jgi:hypothetical protein
MWQIMVSGRFSLKRFRTSQMPGKLEATGFLPVVFSPQTQR